MGGSEHRCWVTEVKHVLSRDGFYCVCLRGIGDEKRFLSELKQSPSHNFVQQWNATIRDKDGYFPYRSVKSIF